MRLRTTRAFLAAAATISGSALGQATTNPDAAKPAPIPAAPAMKKEANLTAWWNDAVFYQVFVRSFADSRSGPLANDGVGDLRGLIERLDYLNDGKPDGNSLGVTALWLMPIMQSPSYHGYDVADYLKVDDEYGTNEDFRELLAQCRTRGIRVILDFVPNHCSWDNPWFKNATDPKSPTHDWFVWQDKKPAWKGPWNQDVWHPWPPTGTPEGYYYGIFWKGMPDLNFRHPDASKAMIDAFKFWMPGGGGGAPGDGWGVDGFRIDAIRHLIEEGQQQESTAATHAWLKEFFKQMKAVNKDVFTVGEVWADTPQVAPYVGDELDSAFEFMTAYAMIDAINEGKRDKLDEQWKKNLAQYPHGQYSTFLSNHDQDRVMSRFNGGNAKTPASPNDAWAKMRLAATLLLTSPGIPFVYYGEELGMVGVKPDEDLRTPMQWTSGKNAGFTGAAQPWRTANKDALVKNVEMQQKDPKSLLSAYRKLIRLRKDYKALRTGEMTLMETGDPAVFAFARTTPDETLIVVANVSDKPTQKFGLTLPDAVSKSPRALDLLTDRKLARPTKGKWKPLGELGAKQAFVIKFTDVAE